MIPAHREGLIQMAHRNNVLNVCDKVIFLKAKDTDRHKNKSPYTLLFYSFVLF